MTDKLDYFERAQSWAVNTQVSAARTRRVAWTVAGAAAGIAMLEAVALALLVPLKTVQPVTILVDRQTGFVQALDPVQPRRIAADEALTQSLLSQYVAAREGFDRATISADYRKVALWSGGAARSTYLAEMPATNPGSPFQRYPGGTIVSVRVKSVSKLNDNTALVRFDTLRQDRSGFAVAGQPWVSVVRFRFSNAPMQLEDRLVNPLGFQVVGYRRDAEAPAMPTEPAQLGSWSAQPTPPAMMQPVQPQIPPTPVNTLQRPAADRRQPARLTGETRLVPLNQIPLGSPLASNTTLSGAGLP